MRYVRVSFLFLTSLAFAQTGTEGSILGVVKDSSGGLVPSASVVVTNTDTGLSNPVKTDVNGFFQVMALPRGTYSVTVSAAAFSTWRLSRAELTAGEFKRIEPVLTVGDVKQEVSVQGGTELIQTERASVETAIEQKQIRDLPSNGRDPVQMVNLAPGMRYLGVGGNVQAHQVQGLGQHSDATQFSVDGMDANDPSLEQGVALPNLDSVAQFRVQTSSFSAADGRQPLQVQIITKSGTNQFHGTLWEFLRNDTLDARNTFALTKPKLRRNQYGFSAGGPIIKNRTFFFTSYEGLKIRQDTIYNQNTIDPAFLNGDFSSVKTAIIDPQTGKQFPGNQIPVSRFSNASKFFFPYLVLPNSPGNLFRSLASNPEDGSNWITRVDQQLTQRQKLYVRWIRVGDGQVNTGYRPDVTSDQEIVQHNTALNYDWAVTPSMLLSLSGGFLHSNTGITSPLVGKENLDDKAGIQGFATAFRPDAIGLPTVAIAGYQGFGWPTQVPATFKREILDGRSSLSIVRGKHTIIAGGEYLDHRTLVHHASADPRGTFTFNNQYTGNGIADYLLGLVQSARANVPLAAFGIAHSPYSGLYADETWRIHPNLTINAGVRWDQWWEKAFVRGGGTTFDLTLGKAVAGEGKNGQVDLSAQPVAPFFAAATQGLWVPASQAHVPAGLFDPSGYVSPRLGIAWRPSGKQDFVVRAGYGIFASSFYGNATGSSIIGPPYWASQQITFAKASNQRWETAFPADPSSFVAPSIASAVSNIKPMKIQEFNFSVQHAIPFLDAAATISYIGSRGRDLTALPQINTAPPGNYTNLQAALPYPQFGTINLYQSLGHDWYNSLQARLDKRFANGLTYLASYAFSRDIAEFGAESTAKPTPYAPAGYDRGPSPNERRHLLTISGIYELPFGRGKRFGAAMPRLIDAVFGGWEIAGLYRFASGSPLTFTVPGATLGNGVNTRPNLVGDPHASNPNSDSWFNTAAFADPPRYQFGNSGVGILQGPRTQVLDTNLMKNLHVTESTYFQFRWEMFNAPNHVNLNSPNTTIDQPSTGRILSAGDARQMQLALKFIF